MSDKLKEFVRQTLNELRANLSVEERLKVMASLSKEERLTFLASFPAEEIIQGLPPETLEALARQLKANGQSSKPQ